MDFINIKFVFHKNIFLFFIYLLIILFSLIFIVFHIHQSKVSFHIENIEPNKTIEIPFGSNSEQIASILINEGLLENKIFYKFETFIRGKSFNPKAGEYLIPENSNLKNILDIFHQGKSIHHRITFPECWKNNQILKKINENKLLSGEIQNIEYIEGTLLPETYIFVKGFSRNKLLIKMKNSMDAVLTELWDKRSSKLPFKNKFEALIIASMIESETSSESEKKIISSVFFNRIKKNMKLQSDPTVVYGYEKVMKEKIEKLTRKHLKIDHEWNTYTRKGLPETPICNPGKSSIIAAFNPFETNYFYFVSDGMGGHFFSKSLSDHIENIKYVKKLKQDISHKRRKKNEKKLELLLPLTKPKDLKEIRENYDKN